MRVLNTVWWPCLWNCTKMEILLLQFYRLGFFHLYCIGFPKQKQGRATVRWAPYIANCQRCSLPLTLHPSAQEEPVEPAESTWQPCILWFCCRSKGSKKRCHQSLHVPNYHISEDAPGNKASEYRDFQRSTGGSHVKAACVWQRQRVSSMHRGSMRRKAQN